MLPRKSLAQIRAMDELRSVSERKLDEISSSQGVGWMVVPDLGVSATFQARLVRRSKPASNVHSKVFRTQDTIW
jgi:hypothetical protein